MKMIYGPNRWSCLPTSLAMIAGVTLDVVIQLIGHDGSEIVDPDEQEPYCFKAFEWQEIVKAALDMGIALVEYPTVLPISGILLGTSENDIAHACAWNGQLVFDPAAGRRQLSSFRYDTFFVALQLSDAARQEFRQAK